MKKCKHKWVDMEDGTLDKFCVRCSKKAKQAQISYPSVNIGNSMSLKESSERNTIKFDMGGKTVRELSVDMHKAAEHINKLVKGH